MLKPPHLLVIIVLALIGLQALSPNIATAYFVVNILPGLGLYLILKPEEYSKSAMIGYSLVYSTCFTPVLLYIARVFDFGTKLGTFTILLAPFIISLFLFKRTKQFLESPPNSIGSNLTPVYSWSTVLVFTLSILQILIVYIGFVNHTTIYNNVYDLPKHWGTVVSVAKTTGLHIDNPFAKGFQMFYYFFFYFESSALMILSNLDKTYEILPISFILESISIAISLCFVLFRLGVSFNKHPRFILLILTLFLLDGGTDSLMLLATNKNIIINAHIPTWVWNYYAALPVSTTIAHMNIFLKLIWQPQHCAAFAPFLLILLNLTPNNNRGRTTQTIVMSLCVLSMIGYSALVAFPALISIGFISLLSIVARKDWSKRVWNRLSRVSFLLFGIIGSIPLILSYIAPMRGAGLLRLRDIGDFWIMLKAHPLVTSFNTFGAYGTMSALSVIAAYTIIRKRRITFAQITGLIIILTSVILVNSIMTRGVNDIGIAISNILFLGMTVFVLASDVDSVIRRPVVLVILLTLFAAGLATNIRATILHQSIKPRNERAEISDIFDVSRYLMQHADSNECALFLSSLDRYQQLNRFLPYLTHLRTFYPWFDGMRYFSAGDYQTLYLLRGGVRSDFPNTLAKYNSLGVDYYIVGERSVENFVMKSIGQREIYRNGHWIVYKRENMVLRAFDDVVVLSENLLRNGRFDKELEGWTKISFVNSGNQKVSLMKGQGNRFANYIQFEGKGDFGVKQTVAVEPNTIYKLCGWRKVRGLEGNGKGLYLGVAGDQDKTMTRRSSCDWEYCELIFHNDQEMNIDIVIGIGGWGYIAGNASIAEVGLYEVRVKR